MVQLSKLSVFDHERNGVMFGGISRLTMARTRVMLIFSAVMVAAMTVLGIGAFGKLEIGGFSDPSEPSSHVKAVINEKFGGEPDLVLLVKPEGGPTSAAAARAGKALTADLKREPSVGNVVSYWDAPSTDLVSKDGGQALILAHVKGDESEVSDRATTLTDRYTGDHGAITVRAGGSSVVSNEVDTQVTSDLALAEGIAVPIMTILLVLVFGSLLAALLPPAISLVAVMGTLAELNVIGSLTDVSAFAINITTSLGLGIDYALLLVNRFREQLGNGEDVTEAPHRTMNSAGRTIAFSAGTVTAALSALLVFPQYFLRSFAYAGIGVVAIAALNAGRLPRSSTVRRSEPPHWARMAKAVMHRPALIALPAVAALLVLASPLLSVAFGTPDERVLPSTAESRSVTEIIDHEFPGGDSSAIQVVAKGSPDEATLNTYGTQLSHLPGLERVAVRTGTHTDGKQRAPGPETRTLSQPGAQRITVTKSPSLSSETAEDLVHTVRAVAPQGTTVFVSGSDPALVDSKHAISSRVPLAIGWGAATTFIQLFLFTGSMVQPVRALVLALSLTAAIGAMVWVFQNGHLSRFLGFTPMPMDTSMTVLMFCVAFGLSMDYEVFVTSRIKELHDAGVDTTTAVSAGPSRTGRLVTMAAALLAVSFFALGTGKVSFIQVFGLASGLAILLGAVVVRGILLPAAICVLGGATWYAPRALRAVYLKVGLSDTEGDPVTPSKLETSVTAGAS
ncbi:MMPL family transporter [Streptomyces sp. NPDC057717]|uniref:MMPL family transporter n=1 Tax=Streptomyces sp. NPDC057717 TaxID=3346224 RepID=UPI0036ABA1B5